MIYKLGNLIPKIGKNNFIFDNAAIIGNVITGENVSIWSSATLRGDMSQILIGNNSNIQDNSTIHGDTHFPVTIGSHVTIGHNCVIHGCTIGNNCVIGMGAIILNGSIIPDNCIVGAGSVVNSKLIAEEGDLIIGSPAKSIKKLSAEQMESLKYSSELYFNKIEQYKNLELIDNIN